MKYRECVPLSRNINEDELIKIIEVLSSMEESDISGLEISADNVMQIVESCQLMKKLQFVMDKNTDFHHLNAKFKAKWQVTVKKFEDDWYTITIVKR